MFSLPADILLTFGVIANTETRLFAPDAGK
jgi:hypothetical protein